MSAARVLSAVDALSVPAEASGLARELPSTAAEGLGFVAGVSLHAVRATTTAAKAPKKRLWTGEFAMGSLGAAEGEAATAKSSSVARLAA